MGTCIDILLGEFFAVFLRSRQPGLLILAFLTVVKLLELLSYNSPQCRLPGV